MRRIHYVLGPALILALVLAGCGTRSEVETNAAPEPEGDHSFLAASDVPDIDTFMQIGYAGSPALTRDARTLYFTSNASGVSQVYRLDRVDGWPYQLSVFTEGIDYYTLSPTDDYLVCGVAAGGNENAQLWLMDARTGQTEPLTDQPEVRHFTPAWTHDGGTIIYSSNEANGTDFYLYTMDLGTREKAVFADMEGWNFPGDVSNDDRWILITHYYSNTNTDVYMADLTSGERVLITPHEGEATFTSAQFDANAEKVYVVSNDNEDGIARRAVIDVDTKELTFLDTEGVWEVEGMGLSPDRKVMGWTVNEDGYSRLHLIELAGDRELPVPPLDGQIQGFSFSDTPEVALSFTSAVDSPDIVAWNWRTSELRKLTHSTYAGVDPGSLVMPKLIRYASFDSLEIPAFLYLPPDYEPGKPVPFVVHVHGGPESQFRPGFIRHFQYLLLNGFGILAPNVRGSAGYGREYMDMDNYKNRLDSVKDLKAGADWLIANGYSAPGLLAVKGGSYGGYMTLAAITEYPDLFSAAIDDVGIANFKTFLENTAEYRRYLREAEYGPLSDPEFLESISPLNKAGLIETPLLVVHGQNDPRVPVTEALQIADAIRAKGGEVETLIFPDEGHGVSKRANVLVLYRKMVEFLNDKLKDQPAS